MVTDKYGCLHSVYGSVKLSNRKWLQVKHGCLGSVYGKVR